MSAPPTQPPNLAPSLRLPSDLVLGYRGPAWKGAAECAVLRLDCDIELNAGLHFIIAANGSGKTTLMRTLAGLQGPLRGHLALPMQAWYYADDLSYAPELNAAMIFAALLPPSWMPQAMRLAQRLRLDCDRPCGQLSRGSRQKITLVLAETRAQCSVGTLLLQDESLAGIDAWTRREIASLWASPSQDHCRLLALHETDALEHADSILSIEQGVLRQHRVEDTRHLRQLCQDLIA